MSHHHDRPHGQVHWTRKPHVKWTAIAMVVLMLAAMLIYVLTGDDALVPGQPPAQPTPAAP